MRTNEARWSMDKEGAWVAFRASSPREARMMAEQVQGEYEVTIKQYRQKRSLDANAYLWVLCGKLAEVAEIPKEDVYRSAIKSVGVSDVVCVRACGERSLIDGWKNNGIGWFAESMGDSKIEGCRNVTLYYGSSSYNTKEMSRLIDYVVDEAKMCGVETMTPAELALLKDGWK